jgi:hypothetical protein
MLETGRFGTLAKLAAAEHINAFYVAHILRLTQLAPAIVEVILDGRQPEGVTLRVVMKGKALEWRAQTVTAAL